MFLKDLDSSAHLISNELSAGYWNWDITATDEQLDIVFRKLLCGETEFFPLKNIFKEDLASAMDLFCKHSASNGEIPYKINLRYRRQNGDILYILCKGKITQWNNDSNPFRMTGCQMDISEIVERKNGIDNQNEQHRLLIDSINAGIWDWNILTGEEWWSDTLYALLGYKRGEIEATYDIFHYTLLHPDDRQKTRDAMNEHLRNKNAFVIDIRIRSKDGNYRWFESTGKVKFNEDGKPVRMVGSIIDRHERKMLEMQLERNEFLLNETGKMAKVGGWEYDLTTSAVIWTKEVYHIHEIPFDVVPDMALLKSVYTEEGWNTLYEAVNECICNHKEYDVELLAITPGERKFWLRAIGKPVVDAAGNVVMLRGTVQDIDEMKKKEIELQKSISIINSQNQRLNNYSHIVSHNLRTHAGNIDTILTMIEESVDAEEKENLMAHLRKISSGLTETVEHLNDVAQIQIEIQASKISMRFTEIFDKTRYVLMPTINETNATIEADFSQLEEVEYIPAYLESIILNLMSNAIKYRHPQRKLHISVKSFAKDNKNFLQVSDNGQGIDLVKHRHKLFGMYQTFHKNPDARGIGLFMTKNQLEALGGNINVTSEPGVGSTFLIQF